MPLPGLASELDALSDNFADPFRDADVVMIGEHHDNALHHAVQTRLVAALGPSGVVFEMIEPEQARGITPELRGNAISLEAHLEWEDRGWPDFATYYPIFVAAKDAGIFGGAAPRASVRQAVGDGAETVFGDASGVFGLDVPLGDNEQTAREALQMAAHCNALPEDILPGMVEAQRLRDAAMAKGVVNALQQGGDGPVILIAGNGHIREDWGVPAALQAYADATDTPLSIVTLAQYENEAPDSPAVTHWIVTPGVDRGDPCEGLR